MAVTSLFDACQVGKTTETIVELVATYVLKLSPLATVRLLIVYTVY